MADESRTSIEDESEEHFSPESKVGLFVLAGLAILMISSELTEVVGMADRVIVMREGRITGELQGADATEESIMHLATTEHAA